MGRMAGVVFIKVLCTLFIFLIVLWTMQAKSHPVTPLDKNQDTPLLTHLIFPPLQNNTLVIIPFDRTLPYRDF